MILKIKCVLCGENIGERVKDFFTDEEINETILTTKCNDGHDPVVEIEE